MNQPKDSPQESEQNSKVIWWSASKHAAASILAGALLLAFSYGIWFFNLHPEFEAFAGHNVNSATIPGRALAPVKPGNWFIRGEHGVITRFESGREILATNVNFLAEDYPFLQFNVEGLTSWARATVFWRRADQPNRLYQLPLARSGDGLTQIAMVSGGDRYRGRITELGIGFISDSTGNDNDNHPIEIHSLELRPFSLFRVATQIYDDWSNPPLWQGYSINVTRGIHNGGLLFPNVVTNILVITGFMLALLYRVATRRRSHSKRSPPLLAVGLMLCIFGWVFNDVFRWQWRIDQLSDTHQRYQGLPLEQRIRNNNMRCGRSNDCFESLLPHF